jgi:hypothetical protein
MLSDRDQAVVQDVLPGWVGPSLRVQRLRLFGWRRRCVIHHAGRLAARAGLARVDDAPGAAGTRPTGSSRAAGASAGTATQGAADRAGAVQDPLRTVRIAAGARAAADSRAAHADASIALAVGAVGGLRSIARLAFAGAVALVCRSKALRGALELAVGPLELAVAAFDGAGCNEQTREQGSSARRFHRVSCANRHRSLLVGR